MNSRCLVKSILNKTPYELMNKRKSKMSYFNPFSCKCYVLNNGKNDLGKLDLRNDEEVFVGYSSSARLIGSITKEHNVQRKVFMLCSMKPVVLMKETL